MALIPVSPIVRWPEEFQCGRFGSRFWLSWPGKKGGKARLQTMTEDERNEVARKAAQARWSNHKNKSEG